MTLPPDFDQMKTWFGDGEQDVDLMLRMGVLTAEQLVHYCHALTDSPWYIAPEKVNT